MLFGWFITILGLLSDDSIIFDFSFFEFTPTFEATLPGHKTRPWGIF
jgi:hypothetical protein